MIKVGDKVVCVKSFTITGQKFFKGKSYEVSIENFEYGCDRYVKTLQEIYILGEVSNKVGGGYWFRINYENNVGIKPKNSFREHFCSLAEWRDSQINSILDDN